MPDVTVLEVLFHGSPIGTLTRVAGDRTLFAFNEAYIADADRPTLGLRFKDQHGQLITDFKPVQTKVMPFFSNLLPEGPLRVYLADRAGVRPDREFFLLWVLGRDLPGAVTIRPADGEAWPQEAITRGDTSRDAEQKHNNALRFSLAGVQLKFSAVKDARGGLTIPATGTGGAYIVKLPSQTYAQVPENEFSMMTLAGQVGINVPPINLVDIGAIANLPDGIGKLGAKAFVIERFDRLPNGELVHIEDFAQVFDVYPEDKYKTANMRNIARVIAAESDDDDLVELVRRMTFNTLIGNGDMHLKNWSLIYPDRAWVHIYGMQKSWERADVDATIEKDTLTVKTKNITALELTPGLETFAKDTSTFVIIPDGRAPGPKTFPPKSASFVLVRRPQKCNPAILICTNIAVSITSTTKELPRSRAKRALSGREALAICGTTSSSRYY